MMTVGVVGLGLMGRALAEALLQVGHVVLVWNRTQTKAQPILRQGAQWRETPAAVAAESAVVLSMVTDPDALAQVSLGENGVLAALPPEAVHADMSTITPAAAAHLAETYAARGRRFVHAPVLGSVRQIQARTLMVFGGGASEALDACEPVWNAFTGRVWRFPAPAQAATAKLACNALIAHMIVGLGQSLLLAQAGGVSPSLLLEILAESAMGCGMYASKGEKLLTRDFAANFFVRNMLKDLSLVSEAAAGAGTPLPLHGLTRELFVSADRQGWGGEDYSAVIKVLEGLAGTELNNAVP